MEDRTMTAGKLTRMESHYEAIDGFLKSNASNLPRRLYPGEIRTLENRFPEIKIEKESVYQGGLYNCSITRN